MEARILSCYAGGHAQCRVDPATGRDGCDTDDEIASDLLRQHGWQDREQDLRKRSGALVDQYWPQIEAVADELLRVRVLNDTEVEIICDCVAGDPEADLEMYRRNFGDRLKAWRRVAGGESKGNRWGN